MTIVKLMEAKVPQLKENEDYEQTLWDHLYLMSQKQLDIDWPFDVSGAEKIHDKPKPMQLPKEGIALRHYGRLVEELLDKLKTMPAGEERDALTYFTANQMKRDLATWGHGSADDEKVANDIARYTDGVIQIDLNSFTFEKVVVSEENRRSKRKK